MKIVIPKTFCKYRHRPDAACRGLARCRRCGRVLQVFDHAPDVCHRCAELDGLRERVRRATMRTTALEAAGAPTSALQAARLTELALHVSMVAALEVRP